MHWKWGLTEKNMLFYHSLMYHGASLILLPRLVITQLSAVEKTCTCIHRSLILWIWSFPSPNPCRMGMQNPQLCHWVVPFHHPMGGHGPITIRKIIAIKFTLWAKTSVMIFIPWLMNMIGFLFLEALYLVSRPANALCFNISKNYEKEYSRKPSLLRALLSR